MSFSLGLTLGANEIGTLISSVFLGITTVQLYNYYKNDFKDPTWIRLLVTAIWVLEATHTIFIWIYLYNITVTHYGDPTALMGSPWTLSMSSVFDGIIGGAVQSYFAYRVYVLSKSLVLPIMSWLGSALQLSMTLAIAIIGSRTSIDEFALKFSWIVTTCLVANVAVDILNTSALCYFLVTQRSRQQIRKTREKVDKLIAWTLETGLATSIAAILMLALFQGEPGTALWIAITLFYAKLYSNCLLASLNGRVSLRQMDRDGVTSTLHVNVSQGSHTMADFSSRDKTSFTQKGSASSYPYNV